jgi:hypothetical protein
MKRLFSIIILGLFWSTFTLASSDVIFEYNEKLLNKKLSTQEVLKICKEYESKNIDATQYDQMTLNTDIGMNNYCSTIKMRSEFKQESKYNLVKDLDIEKLNFNYFASKDFTISIPILEITKSSSCFVNLKEEKVFDYSQILKRCGIKKFITKERGNICPASGCDVDTIEWKEDGEENSYWISIIDYFYADANNDDYMDLIIRFRDDGSVSSRSHTKTTVITSLVKGKFINTNYEKK